MWAAEKARDEAYSVVEGDEFSEIVIDQRQREVYRRRRMMYELRNVPRMVAARPEMILVSYDFTEDAYECRIFYKEPRPAWELERVNVKAAFNTILELRSHPDPNVQPLLAILTPELRSRNDLQSSCMGAIFRVTLHRYAHCTGF